jgi:hypothetical protein
MKSKKILFITVTILLLILVGGASYMKLKDSNVKTDNSSESKGVFTSIKDALSKNITLVCEFKEDNNVSVKSYIKNGAVRVTSSSDANQSSDIIMKDKKMYMWDEKTKQGFVYDIPESDGSSSDNKITMNSNEVSQSEGYLSMIDKYKDSCKVATIEDSYFVVPSDIKFQDMSKILENLNKQAPPSPNY